MSVSKPADVAHQIKYIASVLRALITSRKQPCTLREILQEYPEVESEPINYTKLGFRSVEDLIRESDEFVLSRFGGETCIAAKYSKNSAHIAALVRGQKSSSCKSNKTKKKAQARMPQRPTYQNWNKNSYSSYGYQKAYPPVSRFIVPQRSDYNNNNNTTQMCNRNAQQNKQVVNPYNREQFKQREASVYKDSHEELNAKKDSNVLNNGKSVQNQQCLKQLAPAQFQQPIASGCKNLHEGPNGKKDSNVLHNGKTVQQQQDLRQSVPAQVQQPIAGGYKDLRDKLNAKKDSNGLNNGQTVQHQQDLRQKLQTSKKQSEIIYQPTPQQSPVAVQSPSKQPQHRTQTRSQFHNMRASRLGTNCVQDRLKITIANDHFKPNNGVSPEPSELNSSSPPNVRKNSIKKEIIQQIISPNVFHFNPKLDPVTSLFQYCVARRCHQPEYSFFRSQSTRLYQCRILINGSIYSTYPIEYPSEETAKTFCAALTIEEIKAQESRRQLPICPDSDAELLLKIYQELKSHPHGIFAKNFSEWFESTFEQLLPDHWWSLIEGSEHFITETTPSDNVIIFANNELDSSEGQESESESFTVEAITLPWTNQYWNLYIRHCETTEEIWARLYGEEYSDRYDNLMNDMDVYMMTHKIRPVSLECKQIYIVCISDCWHRVRLMAVDEQNGLGRCFFIDYGDEDWLPVKKLYICENKFLKLAPQAVAFSLFGLEDFAGNPNAKRHLDEMLTSRSLVGEIITKKDVYQAGNADGNAVFRIQVVLYDTSTHEDVNLNSLILRRICEETPPPKIKPAGLTTVQVTHVSDQGDVFLQLQSSELQFVQKLIHQLIETQFQEDKHKVAHADVLQSSMFLISDKSTNQWYRGVLANAAAGRDKHEFDIFYVDYGMTKKTHISRMFHLDSLSTALSKYPRQAIKAKLHNIPPITRGIVARIRGLLPVDSRALVKIGTPGEVVVYKRFVGSEALCNVNEAIRIEQELECLSPGDNNPTPPGENNNNELDFLGVSLHKNFVAMNQTFVDLTVTHCTQKRDHYMTPLKNYEDVPIEGKYFEVRVAMSANPSNFTVQPYKHFAGLQKLMKDLQDYCEKNDESIPAGEVEIGQAYAGKSKDGFYHRVTVSDVIQGMIHVSFCDFGDVDIVRSDQLKTLPAKFRTLPKQAIQAKLHGINGCSVDWEDCLRFRNLTVGKTFVSIVKKITKGDRISPETQIIELDLIDLQNGRDVYIRDVLFRRKTAPLRHTAIK